MRTAYQKFMRTTLVLGPLGFYPSFPPSLPPASRCSLGLVGAALAPVPPPFVRLHGLSYGPWMGPQPGLHCLPGRRVLVDTSQALFSGPENGEA